MKEVSVFIDLLLIKVQVFCQGILKIYLFKKLVIVVFKVIFIMKKWFVRFINSIKKVLIFYIYLLVMVYSKYRT